MEKYWDVMRGMIGLSTTCGEAIELLHERLHQNQIHEMAYLMADIADACNQLEKSTGMISSFLLSDNRLEELTKFRTEILEKLVGAFEQSDQVLAIQVLSSQMIPLQKEWQEEMTSYVVPHVLS
ncbi:hypothetical protein [Brevibacillus laterosporus]|uniref:hypothetical protein n=1 Tax=Brevibacillus laterosporus TaxID=1465 RepID=UPI00264B24D7|nr:hypothetical protein [Brevibacillus laterosporus]MDN9009145.1 hypothetical protein [Brevibacillus laterosporus]MDO0939914.1 hypothetical protein [Brevibacillus laterosporus]